MSGVTAEIIEVCEALPVEKRLEVIDFARFLLLQQGDDQWEKLISEKKSRPRLDEFLKSSADEVDELLELKSL
ncbi:MAG: hypothetical protein WCR44_05980 [Verrucomicrobiota bacterium]